MLVRALVFPVARLLAHTSDTTTVHLLADRSGRASAIVLGTLSVDVSHHGVWVDELAVWLALLSARYPT